MEFKVSFSTLILIANLELNFLIYKINLSCLPTGLLERLHGVEYIKVAHKPFIAYE